jgi:predicted methyltransferase
MQRSFSILALGTALTLAHLATAAAADIPPYASAAVTDAARPDADKARDADRKPAEMVAFAGIKPGNTVIDMLPGGGYFTRIFSKAVGPKGKVYAFVPEEFVKARPQAADGVKAIAANTAYTNVFVLSTPLRVIAAPESADVIWTSQNYHDFHNKGFGGDVAPINRAVFAALKPGGTYIVLDHAAEKGSGVRDTDTLHRIDVEAVKKEVTAAGFVLEGESDAVRHPADDHTGKVFDSGIRGKTDQFVLKFKKPK